MNLFQTVSKVSLLSAIVMMTGCTELPKDSGESSNKPHQELVSQADKNTQAESNYLSHLSGENPNFVKLDNYLDTLAEHNKLMASVAIRHKGELIYDHQSGFASVEKGIMLDADTKFQIGSISKVYTAVLIMQLVELEKLSLQQPLADFFPQFPNAKSITIKHLLSHRSGLFNFTNSADYMDYHESSQTREQMLTKLSDFEPQFEPNAQYEYSNTNYVLLGFIIEDLFKTSYAEVLKQQIVAPLGLSHTHFGDGVDVELNEAQSYQYKGQWQVATQTDNSIPHAAGAVVSTPKEVTAFLNALFSGELLDMKTVKMMTQPGQYGLGLMSYPFYDKVGFGHNGGIDGFVSNAVYFDDGEISMAVTLNGLNYPFNDVLVAILSATYGREFDVPEFAPKSTEGAKNIDFEVFVGEYESKQLPLDIKVFVEGETLMAQATGQGAFPLMLQNINENVYEYVFDAAGIMMSFEPSKNSFVLNQGGGKFLYKKASQ